MTDFLTNYKEMAVGEAKNFTNAANAVVVDHDILLVIDMQKDFAEKPNMEPADKDYLAEYAQKVTAAPPTEDDNTWWEKLPPAKHTKQTVHVRFNQATTVGNFYVAEGESITQSIAGWIKDWPGPVYATVDYHPEGHCSFGDVDGKGGRINISENPLCDNHKHSFPPHCIEGTEGAKLCPEILEALNGRKDSSHDTKVFHKGFHKNLDSFGGVKYSCATIFLEERGDGTMGGKMDPCNDTETETVSHPRHKTGAFNLNDPQVKEFNAWGVAKNSESPTITSLVALKWQDPDVPSLFSSISSHLLGDKGANANIYVVGLAGDWCVLDTCRNLSALLKKKGIKKQVYFVLNHTRFAWLGEKIGFINKPSVIIAEAGKVEHEFNFVNLDIKGARPAQTKTPTLEDANNLIKDGEDIFAEKGWTTKEAKDKYAEAKKIYESLLEAKPPPPTEMKNLLNGKIKRVNAAMSLSGGRRRRTRRKRRKKKKRSRKKHRK